MLPICYTCECGIMIYGANYDEIMANITHECMEFDVIQLFNGVYLL